MGPPVTDAGHRGCADLIGITDEELVRRFGEPSARRSIPGEEWLVFDAPDLTLRVRCAGPGPTRVASWTATFAAGHPTLRRATEILGLWPSAGPDQEAAACEHPLIRRPLPSSDGAVHSLTATVRADRITAISVFDEAPEWI